MGTLPPVLSFFEERKLLSKTIYINFNGNQDTNMWRLTSQISLKLLKEVKKQKTKVILLPSFMLLKKLLTYFNSGCFERFVSLL